MGRLHKDGERTLQVTHNLDHDLGECGLGVQRGRQQVEEVQRQLGDRLGIGLRVELEAVSLLQWQQLEGDLEVTGNNAQAWS